MGDVRLLPVIPPVRHSYAAVLRKTLPGRRGSTPSRSPETAPNLVLGVHDVALDPTHLAAYLAVCGFAPDSPVPSTYPQTVAFPLQLALISDDVFPFAALGLVHIGNRIVQQRALRPGDRVAFEVGCRDLRAHPRGRQLTVVTTAAIDGDEVWRGEMTLLSRGKAGGPPAPGDGSPSPADADPAGDSSGALPDEVPAGPQVWRLPADLGRRYAAVSGDRNPIHLYDLTARPLGFKKHIAHGMWTHARCLAEIANRLPAAHTVDVAFKKPVPLPGTVGFGARQHGDVIDFGVSSARGPHLLGRATGHV